MRREVRSTCRRGMKSLKYFQKGKGKFPSEIWNLGYFARLRIIGLQVKTPFNHISKSKSKPLLCKKQPYSQEPWEGFIDDLRSNHQASAISADILPGPRTKILNHHHAASYAHRGESTTRRAERPSSRHFLRSRFQIDIFNTVMSRLRSGR